MRKISDRISCFPAVQTPLSADVGVIRCDDEVWIFDVGSLQETALAINDIPERKNVVLSHFHPDHTGNVDSITYDTLYAGAFTCRRLDIGVAVNEHLYFENGIHIFPLPSGHAKGCIGLEYGEYAFLGDAAYSASKAGHTVYNAGLLQELITVLKSLQAKWFLLSHGEPFVRPKGEVIKWLEEIYALRSPRDPYIFFPIRPQDDR